VEPASIAREVADAIATGVQITPFSMRGAPLDLDAAYRSVVELRALRGGRLVGRKIGFTNRGIWARYGVSSPMWGDVLAGTCAELGEKRQSVALSGLAEPRLEPEIALGLNRAPRADMDLAELGDCVGWVAPAFEIVQSIYPGWRFDIADCVVAGALHGRLLLGPRVSAQSLDLELLPEIAVTLCKDGKKVEEGVGANALDGPIHALAHLVALLKADPLNPPLAPGEIVSTGTLTDAWPVARGEAWSARYRGALELEISIRFD
jgi:2-oxo-3-hexenedioate decarboxylase